jgi:U3 small nucleolar RNA-associated protein 20
VLRLLDSPLVQVPSPMAEVVKRCIQAEEASIDVQGVRERIVRIGRVGSVVADEQGADVCARWLIGETCHTWWSVL